MAKTRAEKLVKNISFNITMEVVKLACGLILPRLILSNYGSLYNGIVQSVSQFISCIALMKLGIGGATKAALYKPLANKDDLEISSVLASTEQFMKRISMIFLVFLLIFASIYPIWISTDFEWFFTFSLILIISISTFAEYYFGFTYQMLVTADQKEYICSILAMVTIILNTAVSVILINNNFSIHVVKLGSAVVNVITPIFLYIYCHKKYNLIKINSKDVKKLPQRWDAFAHESASFINDNTDIMILTVFTNLLEVSVYTVYHYVSANLKKIIISLTNGFGPAFGDMYARKEEESMKKSLSIFELMTYSFSSIVYSSALVLIVPFALLYTKGITDINYKRPLFGVTIVLAGMFDCFRYPYKQIINNTGHYKDTKRIAVGEAIINIIISISMVIKFGLVGVAIGTLCTMIFGALSYSHYLSKKVIKRNYSETIKHIFVSLLIVLIIWSISRLYMTNVESYLMWIFYATITGVISCLITIFVDLLFYRKDTAAMLSKIKGVIRKKLG